MWQTGLRSLLIATAMLTSWQSAGAQPLSGTFGHFFERVRLVPYASIQIKAVRESSGIVKSRKWPDVFWTLNDSGNGPRLFAIHRQGTSAMAGGGAEDPGVAVTGARNVDWEDMAADNDGHLIIGDIGNNASRRKDLCLYVVEEPDPARDRSVAVRRRIGFRYPDGNDSAFGGTSFDAEALFWADGSAYILTKQHLGRRTRLYRLDFSTRADVQVLSLVDEFEIGGMVTAADATEDGSDLAVLTYGAVLVFDKPAGSDRYLSGTVRWLPIRAGQCEAVAFDGGRLVITNEAGELFEIEIDRLRPLRR